MSYYGEPEGGEFFRDSRTGEIFEFIYSFLNNGDTGYFIYHCVGIHPETIAGTEFDISVYKFIKMEPFITLLTDMEVIAWTATE